MNKSFIEWFRHSAPYIHNYRMATFVICLSGEVLESANFSDLIHDIALLKGLGIRPVIVFGIRPQIEQCLRQNNHDSEYIDGLRVTNQEAITCVKQVASAHILEIEALLSMGLSGSPMDGARIKVVSGNFISARPYGVHDGVDFQHTGEIRRVDVTLINNALDAGAIVVAAPIGHSVTGEVFNLKFEQVAVKMAIELQADKLIYLLPNSGPISVDDQVIHQFSLLQAELYLQDNEHVILSACLDACRAGISRCHLIPSHVDGALLEELYSRDGVGTLVTDDAYDFIGAAEDQHLSGIVSLIEPLQIKGVLVPRSMELIERELDQYVVAIRDGLVVACAAMTLYTEDQCAELSCFVVHKDYQGQQRGEALLTFMLEEAKRLQLKYVFILTTQTSHWFLEQGFKVIELALLPASKQRSYNKKRASKTLAFRL